MISLYDLLRASNGQLYGDPAAQLFTDFCLDPQQAREGLLYVALRTSQVDTHHYIEEAIQNGVSGVICVGPPGCDTTGVSVLMVRDTVEALMSWAQFALGKMKVRRIVVSGSSAKSLTAAAITRVLATRYRVHQGNLDDDGRLSLALSMAHLSSEYDYVVMKLEITQPDDMRQMVETLQPDIGIITNIDCVHRSSFASCQQYREDYYALVDYLRSPDALLILNNDDEATREMLTRAKGRVRTIGIDVFGADMMMYNLKPGLDRTGFDLRYEERYLGRWSPVVGKQHLYSLLAALTIGVQVGIPLEDALKALTELPYLPGRMNPLNGRSGAMLIDDTYKAGVASTMMALDWLNYVRMDGQRIIFVMGDIDHLGKNSQYAHRSIGLRAAEVADVIVTQGAQAALVGRAAIDQGKDINAVRTTYSVQDAVAVLDDLKLNENDIVLIKGGESVRMEEVVRALLADPADARLLVRQQKTAKSVSLPSRPLHPAWLEIDREAFAGNVRVIRQLLPPEVTLMAVVKANAYGHGAIMAARIALLNGAGYLAVANIAEALTLRDAGIEAPILVLSYTPASAVRQAVQQNITVTVFDLELARMYDRAARDVGGQLKYHVKLDTGMGRLGVLPADTVAMFRHLHALKHVALEGIMTHFSAADTDPAHTQTQLETFKNLVRMLRAGGFQFKYVHAANSAAVLRSPDYFFNMVRPGLVLYGLTPETMTLPAGLRPLLTWKTTVLQVKLLPAGHPVGYGNTYITRGPERIAILPVGYADGLRRAPATWREVLINGQRVPLVGRVSMEKCAVNVTDIDVSAGDEVVLLGKQGSDEITPEEVAGWLGTSNYEVVTTIMPYLAR
ncbi:MAG: alanine racemase [Anaerolineae bacterium]|nr:alanine racemase [Anaerolineae bacterium]